MGHKKPVGYVTYSWDLLELCGILMTRNVLLDGAKTPFKTAHQLIEDTHLSTENCAVKCFEQTNEERTETVLSILFYSLK